MNKEYILQKIKPYLNQKNMLGEADFDSLFSNLEKNYQYKIVEILIEEDIDIDYDNVSKPNLNKTFINQDSSINMEDLTKSNNEQLCLMYQNGFSLAMDALLIKNEKLIWSRVLRYSKAYAHKLEENDLYQIGFLGFQIAVTKFDASKETRLTTYAIIWIDQQIRRAIADIGFTIRLPVHYFGQIIKFTKILSLYNDISQEKLYLILSENGIDLTKYNEYLMTINNIINPSSLDIPVGEDGDSQLLDILNVSNANDVYETVETKMRMENIQNILKILTERERFIIQKRFGLCDDINKTLEEIGNELGVTRERIRQIEARALNKLRKYHKLNKIQLF